jgi:hypothetical protein
MACGCNIANLGYSSCGDLFGLTRKLILVRTIDDEGNRNKISKSDFVGGVLPEAFVTGKLNETADKRWYPLGDFNQVSEVKGDDVLFTDDFGAETLITAGSITYEGYIESAPNTLESKVKTFGCGDFSAFYIDVKNSIVGLETGDDLFPNQIAKGTLRADWIKVSVVNSNVSRLKVNFTLDNSISFGDMNAITQSCNGYDMRDLEGLFDATSTVTVASSTELTVSVKTDGGSFCNPAMVEGLAISDFTLTNVTNSSVITISTLTELSGVYTLGFLAQNTSDVGTLAISKTGFDIPTKTIAFL